MDSPHRNCRRQDKPAFGVLAVVAYSFRHTFTTDGLSTGVSGAVMAEILGHRDTAMIDRHYGHLDQRASVVREAISRTVSFAKPLAVAGNPVPPAE